MLNSLALKPRLSEKAYGLSEKDNTYVFEVPAGANRLDIKRAVTDQYSVVVQAVHIARTAGKSRRGYARRGRVASKGQTSSVRKAYVTLKQGDKLPVFDAIEEAEKQTEKAEKKASKESK